MVGADEPWNRRSAAWFARAGFASISVWIAATMVAAAAGWTVVAAALEAPWLFVCHRIPERTLSIVGTPMPLCSRCAGIWLGISVAGALAWPPLPLRVLRVVVPVAGLLMIVDVIAQDHGWHPLWHWTRMLTGLLLGVPIGGGVGSVILAELGGGAPPGGPATVGAPPGGPVPGDAQRRPPAAPSAKAPIR
ncbi:MAG: DUF2085 domain-containing protein [Polyangiaceae bacterium]